MNDDTAPMADDTVVREWVQLCADTAEKEQQLAVAMSATLESMRTCNSPNRRIFMQLEHEGVNVSAVLQSLIRAREEANKVYAAMRAQISKMQFRG